MSPEEEQELRARIAVFEQTASEFQRKVADLEAFKARYQASNNVKAKLEGKELLRAEIPLQEQVEQFDENGQRILDWKGRPVLKTQVGRTLTQGKNKFRVSGSTVVVLSELPQGHDSELAFEVRIIHPSGTGGDEVNRFAAENEEGARLHFETYVKTLAKQSGHDPTPLLSPLTVPGRLAPGR
jgi:hypothetical protein